MEIIIQQDGLQTFFKPWLGTLDLICLKFVCKSFKQVIDKLIAPIKDYDSCKWIVHLALESGYWGLAHLYLSWMKRLPPSFEMCTSKLLEYPVFRREDVLIQEKIFFGLFPDREFGLGLALQSKNLMVVKRRVGQSKQMLDSYLNRRVWDLAMEKQDVQFIRYLQEERGFGPQKLFPIDLGNCTNLEIAKLADSHSVAALQKGKCSWEVTQYIMENFIVPSKWIIHEYLKHGKVKELKPYIQNHEDVFLYELAKTENEEMVLTFFGDLYDSPWVVRETLIYRFVENRFNRAIRRLFEFDPEPFYQTEDFFWIASKIDPDLFELIDKKVFPIGNPLRLEETTWNTELSVPFLKLLIKKGIVFTDKLFEFKQEFLARWSKKDYQAFVLEQEPTSVFELPISDPDFALKLQERFPTKWFVYWTDVVKIQDVRLLKTTYMLEHYLKEIYHKFYSWEVNEYLETLLQHYLLSHTIDITPALLMGKTWIFDFAKISKTQFRICYPSELLQLLSSKHFYQTEERLLSAITSHHVEGSNDSFILKNVT